MLTLVDKKDYEKFKDWTWVVNAGSYVVGYRTDTLRRAQKLQLLHRLILVAPEGKDVDHKNGDVTDNRKKNIRLCSHLENMRNLKKPKHGVTSIFKGVSWDKRRNKWTVRIQIIEKYLFLGYFDDELKAAKAYNVAATKYFGAFARANPI